MKTPESEQQRKRQCKRRGQLHELRHPQSQQQPYRIGGEAPRRSLLQEADEPPAQPNDQEQRKHHDENDQRFLGDVTERNGHARPP